MTSSQDNFAVLAQGHSKMLPEVTEAKTEADVGLIYCQQPVKHGYLFGKPDPIFF